MEFIKLFETVVGSLISRIAADELKAWTPNTVEKLVGIAVRLLPEDQRERFAEEWLSDLRETPGNLVKLFHALGFIIAAGRIAAEFGSKHTSLNQRVAKRSIDFAISAVSVVLILPLFLLIAISIRLTSKGPIFVYQERMGKGGRPFMMRKFRTMYVDANERMENHLKRRLYQRSRSPIDPRVTPLGRFLRRTSLEALPQFLNVLAGEMSLVGPVPMSGADVRRNISHFEAYCSVRPGITGLWQIWRGRYLSDMTLTAYKRLVSLDRAYAEKRSAWMDLKILVGTVRGRLSKPR